MLIMIAYGQLQGVQISVGGGRAPGLCPSKLPRWLACKGPAKEHSRVPWKTQGWEPHLTTLWMGLGPRHGLARAS